MLLKETHLFSILLAILFNQSVTTGTFPSLLKTAKITPIHKSGPDDDPKNYRPVSELTTFSKIFETLMKVYLTDYLETKNILNPHSHYGFSQKCDTFKALNGFANDILSATDKKFHVLSIFIDFSKAFDTVNHKIFINKMHHYRIRCPVLFLIYINDISYLLSEARSILFADDMTLLNRCKLRST